MSIPPEQRHAVRTPPAQPNNSLIVGIDCLREVVGSTGPVGSREVARRMGMTHTRVNRLLGTLSYMGLLDQDASRRYRPGPGLHALAAQSMRASRLLPAALPLLVELCREGYSVGLGTLWQGQVCFLFHERPGQQIEDALFRHELCPAGHSTIGVAMLAARSGDPPADEDVLDESLEPGETLSTAIVRARSDGYATLRFADGTTSVGVTIGTPPIAGLAVARHHIGSEFIPEIAARLHDAAARIDAEVRGVG